MITLDKIASPTYRDQLAQLHLETTWGAGGHVYAPHVCWLAMRFGGKTVLDYGCGQGTLRGGLQGTNLTITEFDPGIRGRDNLPHPADIVAVIDVLEHVEPDRLKHVLHHIHWLTKKAALMVPALRPAEKRLPDGRNAHLIIENARWWFDTLTALPWELHHFNDGVEGRAIFWARKK